MLKSLFTSTTRVKLLNLFLTNPEKEYFVRELTRVLDEQINSIRRELDNLKKIGLLKSKARNRRKFYVVNPSFLLFKELRSMFMKAGQSSESLVKNIVKMGEPIKFSILTKEDFLYRIKCRDQFILDLVQDEENIVGLNKLGVDFQ
jgi:predicted transcriptional regulator